MSENFSVSPLVLADIFDERRRQFEKWGDQTHHDLYWLGILMEEVGELAQALIESEYATMSEDAREELVQVTAVGLQWLEAHERRTNGLHPEHL